ncbi:MAG: VCBS repeat-containing protein, partial [Myxococcota bacterium]
EPYDASGGFTRLSRVERIGLDGRSVYPVVFNFAYTGALGQQTPVVRSMGSLGVNMASGRATLLDINGDGLPDVLDTTDDGPHRFFINTPDTNGMATFQAQSVESALDDANGSTFRLGGAGVQVLDLNGDGFTDMLNATIGQALINLGTGDWNAGENVAGVGELGTAFAADFDERLTDGGIEHVGEAITVEV